MGGATRLLFISGRGSSFVDSERSKKTRKTSKKDNRKSKKKKAKKDKKSKKSKSSPMVTVDAAEVRSTDSAIVISDGLALDLSSNTTSAYLRAYTLPSEFRLTR
jgi:hypothetical protein